jgi:hypothetical protein
MFLLQRVGLLQTREIIKIYWSWMLTSRLGRSIIPFLGFEMPNMTVIFRHCWLLSLLFLLASHVRSDCVEEFGKCVMNRDCCNAAGRGDSTALECMAGDWAVTTDSTCLSKRSQTLNGLAEQDRIALIVTFYQRVLPDNEKKAPGEVEKLVAKYERKFAQLVLRLEKKYKTSIQEAEEDVTTAQALHEEL